MSFRTDSTSATSYFSFVSLLSANTDRQSVYLPVLWDITKPRCTRFLVLRIWLEVGDPHALFFHARVRQAEEILSPPAHRTATAEPPRGHQCRPRGSCTSACVCSRAISATRVATTPIGSPPSRKSGIASGSTKQSVSRLSVLTASRSSISSRPRTFMPTRVSSSMGFAPQKSSLRDCSTIGRSPVSSRSSLNFRQFCASFTRKHQRMIFTRT